MSGTFGRGGGDFKPRTHESSKFTTVKLTIGGEHFEILVNPDSALSYTVSYTHLTLPTICSV